MVATIFRSSASLLVVAGAMTTLPRPGTAQASWTLQSPLPTGSDIRGVDMVNATEGWAVGTAGEILHTSDAGATWIRQPTGVDDPFNAVCFLDASRGWAAGNRFARTTDGGRTWEVGSVSGTVYGIDFVDPQRGFAVGNGAVAYRTTNGGATWSVVPTGGSSTLKDVDFVDPSTGWAVGGGGQILRSIDGGLTWTPQASTTNAWLDGVCFVGPTEGFVVGWGQLLHTTNGGSTWSLVSDTPGVDLVDVTFLDSLNGWAVGGTQRILRTTNGGISWALQALGDTGSLESISMADPFRGVAVGSRGHVFTTDDGGVSWVSRRIGSVSGTHEFDIVDPQLVWAANDGEVLVTRDGGASWGMLDRTLFQNFPDGIDFFDASRGWMLNAGAITHRTTDGGATWALSDVTAENGIQLEAIAVVDAQTVVVVGGETVFRHSRIYRSTDGGVTWSARQHPEVNWTYYAIDFPDASTGYAVGNFGGISKTTDGGATWFTVRGSSPVQLLEVSFADAMNGWAVGPVGYVVHTADGGATWDEQDLPGSAGSSNVSSVSALSATTAWVSGTNRMIARTIDGGGTWVAEDTSAFPGQGSFPAIAFLDANTGWAGYSTGYPFGRIYRRGVEGVDAQPLCFGDGTRAACPCGNAGSAGRGCENSAGTGGALLLATGTTNPDTVVLRASEELPSSLTIFLQGNQSIAPLAFGDGLRCAGGVLKRLFVKSASGGAATAPGLGDPSITARSASLGDPIAPGTSRWYQAYYRDANPGFCPSPQGSTFNAGNGLRIDW